MSVVCVEYIEEYMNFNVLLDERDIYNTYINQGHHIWSNLKRLKREQAYSILLLPHSEGLNDNKMTFLNSFWFCDWSGAQIIKYYYLFKENFK